MDTSQAALGVYVKDHLGEVLARWDALVQRSPESVALPHGRLRAALARLLAELADHLVTGTDVPPPAIEEHVLQLAGIGLSVRDVTAELLTLREAVERTWPAASRPEARDTLHALDRMIHATLLETIDWFVKLRTGLVEVVDSVLGALPGRTAAESMQGVLSALLGHIEGVDTAAIMLRDGDVLRKHAAVGVEEVEVGRCEVRIGEGLDGLVAVDRAPRFVSSAATSAVVVSPILKLSGVQALYAVPLLADSELFGVAHMGSLTSSTFAPESKALFRALMARVAGLLYQEALREKLVLEQARYQAVVDNAPTIIFLKDLDGRYLSINEGSLRQLGHTPDDFLGRTDREVFPNDVADALRDGDRQVIEYRTSSLLEEDIPGSTGIRTFLTVKFPIVDPAGAVVGVGGVATDITERRRWERRQQLLADVGGLLASSLEVEVALANVVQRVVPVLADASFVEILEEDGSTRRQEVYPPDTSIERDVPQLRLALTARDRSLGSWTLVRRGGFESDDVDLAHELAWRISLALDNARLYELSQQAVRERDEVLGVVAHDLRNPLGHILLAARLGKVGEIEQAAKRMRRLVADLVDRHAIERGRLAVELQQIPADDLVRGACEAQRPLLADGAHNLVLEVADDLPDVLADEGRIRQVFQNLIDNATKFSPAGSEVTVRARQRDHELVVCVRDRGPGIDEQVLPHVFERFWQGRADRRGVGLGLAICKGIVEAHGGRVWAANAPDGGARLCFTLPAATTAPSRTPAEVS